MATRQERIRDRMRGAGRHEVGDDLDFGFVIPIATEPEPEETVDEEIPDASPLPPPPTTSRPTPNTSAKRIHLDRDGLTQASQSTGPSPSRPPRPPRSVYSIPDDTSTERSASQPPRSPASVRTQGSSLRHMTRPPASDEAEEEEGDDDHDVTMHDSQPTPGVGNEDVDMEDAPPPPFPLSVQRTIQKQRGPLSSVIAATKRITIHTSPEEPTAEIEEVVMESPADAPGSGKRQRTIMHIDQNSPVVGSSTLLHKVLEDLDETTQQNGGGVPASSSPLERRVRTRIRKSEEIRKMSESMSMRGSTMSIVSPTSARGKRRSPRLRSSSVVDGEEEEDVNVPDAVEEEEEPEVEEEEVEKEPEVEESTVLGGGDDEVVDVPEPEPELPEPQPEPEPEAIEAPEEEEAEEINVQEAAKRIGRKQPTRRTAPAPSPELGSESPQRPHASVAESPTLRKRRRKEAVASPAQQQQPAKKVRTAKQLPKPKPRPPPRPESSPRRESSPQREPSPQPRRQPPGQEKAKPKPKQLPKKPPAKRKPRTAANNAEDTDAGDEASGSVTITVQRFTKPSRTDGEAGDIDIDDSEIAFSNRGAGVHILDVLSKLCDELAEAYLERLREAGQAAEDAAIRREKKVMIRAMEAFHRELMTKLLDHTIALDQLHGLRKRVKAAQKEKIAMRDEIMRIRAERAQVALRMDAIRIRHEVESKEALRHISLSSAMHDIDLAVEKAQAAPELTAAEQKRADLANLELLVSRVADQASSKGEGGGTLKQIKEFNAFLERAAAAMEGRRM